MSGAVVVAGAVLGMAAPLAGVGLLRLAWRRPQSTVRACSGWALMVLATAGWALGAAWDKAAALALLAPSLAGIALVCAHAQVRPARAVRPRRMTAELPDRSGETAWRGWVRTLYGGPLAGAAALALSAAWALRGPGSGADRLAVALLLAPTLWGLGLAWATTDRNLVRIGGGLGALALAGGVLAAL